MLILTAALVSSAAHSQTTADPPPTLDEAAAIEFIRSKAVSELEHRYPKTSSSLVRRDAHAKAHGCAKATFTVDPDIAIDLRVGSFATPGQQYKTWIRFSNGAFEPGSDNGLDGRGMAVKLIDQRPSTVSPPELEPVHDILMINYSVFFSPNAIDYRDFAAAGALTGNTQGLKAYFMPSYNVFGWRARQMIIAYKIASQTISTPLGASYFSMTPFKFGPERAVKYSARPCTEGLPSTINPEKKGSEFLREALQNHLASKTACFELLVQEHGADMPTDDATAEWSTSRSPYRRVGKITIPIQNLKSEARDMLCENLKFNPWNAPPEHAPLGSLNRVRKAVYDSISTYRATRNGSTQANPAAEWDRF